MSLLLDALRQAEKNKTTQNEKASDQSIEHSLTDDSNNEEKNSPLGLSDHLLLPDYDLTEDKLENDSESFSSNSLNNKTKSDDKELVELEVLSEYDLASDTAVSEQEPKETPKQTDTSDDSNKTDVVTTQSSKTIESTELTEIISPKDEIDPDDDFDYSTDQPINYTTKSKPKSNAVKPDLTQEIKKNIAEVIESSEKELPKFSVDVDDIKTKEKPKTANNIEAANILQSSTKVTKYQNYGIFFLILFILAAAYLYYISRPPSVETNHPMPEALPIPEIEKPNLNPNTQTNAAVNQQNSITNKQVSEYASKTDSSIAVMATPETKSERDSAQINNSKSTSENSTLSDFIVVAADNEISYPKQVKIKIKKQSNVIKRNLHSAYSAYKNQNYKQAESLYKLVLRKDNVNLDALLALGAIAEQKGQLNTAKQFYQRVLRLNGNHIIAKNALIRLHQGQTPSENESLYKSLIQQFPNHAQAHFSLANSYAAQQRWHQAQAEYFKAVELQPNNADFQYNLAISLEQISKNKLALKYYLTALQLSFNNQHRFDKTVVKQRIQQLQEK